MSHWFTSGDNADELTVYGASIDQVMDKHGDALSRLDEVRAQTIKLLTTSILLDGGSASTALSAAKAVVCDYEIGLHTVNATNYEDYKNRRGLLKGGLV